MFDTNIFVVGGGLAGIYTALNLDPRISVIVASKSSNSSSSLAQGGIAAAIGLDDSPEIHAKDTIAAGAGLCEPEAVSVLTKEAPNEIERLIGLGVPFDFDEMGNPSLTKEAGHSRRRVIHAGGDATGREVMCRLLEIASSRANIKFIDDCFVLKLLKAPNGTVCGVRALISGEIYSISASAVVLATGGLGQVYSRTTNPEAATADGYALAKLAGAALRHMEFVQFHPTVLRVPFLITEAIRGEGAVLRNINGERFTDELLTRDELSRAILREIKRAGHNCVYLDTTPIGQGFAARFPTIHSECISKGIDTAKIPIAPAQHYQIGGIAVDLFSKTSIPGLYAVGEVSNTGVHGANRLASNSLLECLVFGRRAANAINNSALVQPKPQPDARSFGLPVEYRAEIQKICALYAGIERDPSGISAGLSGIDEILSQKIHSAEQETCETYNMALTAREILSAALARRKSVGVHYVRHRKLD